MELKATEVLRVLQEKKVDFLYHANTVSTCCTFFQDGHLLARGIVHERGLNQTNQKSDKTDRQLGIWYDIFFDAIDIHTQSSNRNFYGPLSLQFDLDLLTQDWLPNVWVAKSNPIGWKADTPEQDRWFGSIDELEKHYSPTNFGHHIVIRNVGGSIRLSPYLKKVVMDNPRRTLEFTVDKYSVDMISHSYGAIRASLRTSKLLGKGIIAAIRKCPITCNCLNSYKHMSDNDFKKMFLA